MLFGASNNNNQHHHLQHQNNNNNNTNPISPENGDSGLIHSSASSSPCSPLSNGASLGGNSPVCNNNVFSSPCPMPAGSANMVMSPVPVLTTPMITGTNVINGSSISPLPLPHHQSQAGMMRTIPKLDMSLFHIVDEINFGTFGRVYRVTFNQAIQRKSFKELEVILQSKELAMKKDHEFALKVMSKETIIRLQQLEHVKWETRILGGIRFPFIVELYSVFHDDKNHYMLMEHVYGGDLFERMKCLGAFSEPVAKFYAAELVLTLEYLQSNSVVHRDLKPENLMIDEDGHLKLIDFGFAKRVPDSDRTWTICGTPEYMAPEVIQNKGHGMAVDWWSLGVLIYEMVVGNAPFFHNDQRVTLDRIIQGHYVFPSRLSIELIDLLKRLMTRDLSCRLGNLKNGAQDVKNHPWFKGISWKALLEQREKGPLCRENMENFMAARARQLRFQQQQQQNQQNLQTPQQHQPHQSNNNNNNNSDQAAANAICTPFSNLRTTSPNNNQAGKKAIVSPVPTYPTTASCLNDDKQQSNHNHLFEKEFPSCDN